MTQGNPTLYLLITMITLQVAWLVAIWWSKATDRSDKLIHCVIFTAISGLAILLAYRFLPSRWMRLEFEPTELSSLQPAGLAITCILAAAGAYAYARRQRVWIFDETGDQETARMFAKLGLKATLQRYNDQRWIGIQHPPLIPWLGGLLLRCFGDHLLVLRLLSVGFLIGSLVVTYQIGALFYGTSLGLLATLLVLVFPLIWRLGSAAMLDMPATFWFGLALLLSLTIPGSAQKPLWLAATAGLVIGLGLLTRYTMIIIFPVLLALVLLDMLSWPAFTVILLVSLSLFALWLIYAYKLGILSVQANQLLIYSGRKSGVIAPQPQYKGILGKLGITRGWRMRLRLESLVSRLPSALGVYSLAILFVGIIQIFQQTHYGDAMLAAWIGIPFILLVILMPDHRYFLPIFPALALVMARGLSESAYYAPPVVALALLLCAGNLYLFVDWKRQTHLFSRNGM